MPAKLSALDRFLLFHKRSCTYYIFSGDRHCSCGLYEAQAELAELREKVAEYENETESVSE